MAKTISFNGRLAITGDGVSFSLDKSVSATQAGADSTAETQSIGTSAEAIDLASDMSGLGYVMLVNLDATNYIEIALDSNVSTQIFARLRAGEFCIVPVATFTLYAKANTGSCVLAKLAIEA